MQGKITTIVNEVERDYTTKVVDPDTTQRIFLFSSSSKARSGRNLIIGLGIEAAPCLVGCLLSGQGGCGRPGAGIPLW